MNKTDGQQVLNLGEMDEGEVTRFFSGSMLAHGDTDPGIGPATRTVAHIGSDGVHRVPALPWFRFHALDRAAR